MEAYFPRLRHGETVYSAVARLGRHAGVDSTPRLNRICFGTASDRAISCRFPTRLKNFHASLPALLRPALADLIGDHTPFPYYAAMLTAAFRHKLTDTIENGMADAKQKNFPLSRLGPAILRPAFIRYCPDCLAAMIRDHGEGHWRREHQIESSLVCAVHGCDLLPSDVPAVHANSYVSPGSQTGKPGRSGLPPLASGVRDRLVSLAAAGDALLDGANHPAKETLEVAALVELARSKGMVRVGTGKRDAFERGLFGDAVASCFEGLEHVWPDLFYSRERGTTWIDFLIRRRSGDVHPAYPILCKMVLESREDVVVKKWLEPTVVRACLNPLSDHHRQETTHSVRVRRTGDVSWHRFECECGFVFKSVLNDDGTMGRPERMRYGPLIEDHIRRAADRGETIIGICRRLEVSFSFVSPLYHAYKEGDARRVQRSTSRRALRRRRQIRTSTEKT